MGANLNLASVQNEIVMFLELVAAECFYVCRDLFPDFGYGKLK